MQTIKVDLDTRSYNIYIGYDVIGELKNILVGNNYKWSKTALIITDTNIAPIYGRYVLDMLISIGFKADLVSVPAGETSKSFAIAEQIYTRCIEVGLDRKSPIFALGGGVVGDLAGFIAATYMRGIPFVQIPTSLLAQVDSSVGGKVAINHTLGKNLIGAFYQPHLVLADIKILKSLPPREIATGLGEIIKYGIIYDAELFSYLEENTDKILKLDTDAIKYIVARSCEIKAAVVSKDEKEMGLRMILNFGHTIAHAIEKETNYTTYNHGEAVAIGMLGAIKLSEILEVADNSLYTRTKQLIEKLGLPIRAEGISVDKMYADIFHDKKTFGGKVNWVLARSIGEVFVSGEISEAALREAMRSTTDL